MLQTHKYRQLERCPQCMDKKLYEKVRRRKKDKFQSKVRQCLTF